MASKLGGRGGRARTHARTHRTELARIRRGCSPATAQSFSLAMAGHSSSGVELAAGGDLATWSACRCAWAGLLWGISSLAFRLLYCAAMLGGSRASVQCRAIGADTDEIQCSIPDGFDVRRMTCIACRGSLFQRKGNSLLCFVQ